MHAPHHHFGPQTKPEDCRPPQGWNPVVGETRLQNSGLFKTSLDIKVILNPAEIRLVQIPKKYFPKSENRTIFNFLHDIKFVIMKVEHFND
jgi:hypothetical protein